VTPAHREIERKLRVPPGFELPDLSVVEGVAHVEKVAPFDMRATYYDTVDLRLFRWGITFRRREGGSDEGWHLKLPVDSGLARDEIREPLGDDIPAPLTDLVTAFIRGADVQPIATLSTRRSPLELFDTSGQVRAEVVDDTVTVLDHGQARTTFREIEVEAIPDARGDLDEDLIDRVATYLMTLGAEPGTMSKAGAALGPRAIAPADIPELAWPAADDPAGDVVRTYLALHARRLVLADLQLRRDLPDAVHQMRVSARRLRSGLKVFGPLVDESWAQHLRDELGWMASELGQARDTEVLEERLDEHAAQLGGDDGELARTHIDRVLDERMNSAVSSARASLDSSRYVQLLNDLVDGVHRPPLTHVSRDLAHDVLPPLVDKAFRRLKRRVDDLSLHAASEVWHSARISAKRARYAADAVAPVLGPDYERLADRLAEVTDVLGHHQDAYVAQQTLHEMAPSADSATAFALGQLMASEQAAEMSDRKAFRKIWPAARRAGRRIRR
jgi:CHAD domain-containing protein